MLIQNAPDHRPSEITSETDYLDRRRFMAGALGLATASSIALTAREAEAAKLDAPLNSALSTGEPKTRLADITSYNNFYEFGLDKTDPETYGASLKTSPWSVQVDGLCGRPAEYQLEDFVKPFALEERIYRMRCVEGWSMVIPWDGFPLSKIIDRAEPLGNAKFVAFTTLYRPSDFPGQSSIFPSIAFPYIEGLRMDEAMHPLTILATGLYGETLPNQNGAPLRLVVPWKYGFKGIKSIVRISFVEDMPETSWHRENAGEYGFYANVNPEVDHPRWSQATERRIGEGGLFAKRRATLPFNGYAEQVASLYSGMDLRTFY